MICIQCDEKAKRGPCMYHSALGVASAGVNGFMVIALDLQEAGETRNGNMFATRLGLWGMPIGDATWDGA
jgi:hypothetical protein